ncbi:MAG: hypothetical protein C0506_03010 [Anaerolinea sp.]|nr:hypothetical protein [Anaerolinea sp.]
MERVQVSELQAHLREYLERVRAGETLLVAEDGETIASLGPCVRPYELPALPSDALRFALKDLPPAPLIAGDVDLVAILRESRDQR